MPQFIRDLFRRWRREIIGGAILTQVPRVFRWIAEQWIGDRVTQSMNSMGPWIWGWMASHPIQSLVVVTSVILLGFSFETKIWERRRSQTVQGSVNKKTDNNKRGMGALLVVQSQAKAVLNEFKHLDHDHRDLVRLPLHNSTLPALNKGNYLLD